MSTTTTTTISPNYLDLIPIDFFKTLLPTEYTFQTLFEVDYSKWDWSQLLPSRDFKYVEGVTPFSNKNFIFMAIFTYLVTVLSIKFFFNVLNIKGWKLGFVSGIHNLILCIWSFIMWAGLCYDLFLLFQTEHGINALFCSPKSNPITGRIFYWHYLYFVSKFYEFIDTLIIVLKRRELIFLHIWHHAIVVLIVWSWLPASIAYANVGIFANTLVHVFMYYYYFRTSMNPSVRIWWKSYLTSGQLFQFTMSFILAIPFLLQDVSINQSTGQFNHSCKGWGPFGFTMINNLIFLSLFINFYIKTYISSKKSSKSSRSSSSKTVTKTE